VRAGQQGELARHLARDRVDRCGARDCRSRCFRQSCLRGQRAPVPPPGFEDLTPEQKIRYVAALVDDQERLPIPDAQRDLVRQRLAAREANPGAARPWSEVRQEIEQALSARTSR
jgi:hypothetical protein